MKTERDAFLLTILWQFRMAKFKVEAELLFKLVLLLLGEVSAGVLMEFDFEFRISKIACVEGLYSLLCTIRPFFILYWFPDWLCWANSERRALFASRSLGVRSGVMNMRLSCSGVVGVLSLLVFCSIAAFSSSDSTVILKSLGLGPPFPPSLIALEIYMDTDIEVNAHYIL